MGLLETLLKAAEHSQQNPPGSQCRAPDFMHPHPLVMQKNAMATINTMQMPIPIAGTIQNPVPHHITHRLPSSSNV